VYYWASNFFFLFPCVNNLNSSSNLFVTYNNVFSRPHSYSYIDQTVHNINFITTSIRIIRYISIHFIIISCNITDKKSCKWCNITHLLTRKEYKDSAVPLSFIKGSNDRSTTPYFFTKKKNACVSKGKQISKLKLALQDQCTSDTTMYSTINQLHISACNRSICTWDSKHKIKNCSTCTARSQLVTSIKTV
jgi:hypothetical protein